MFSVNIELLLHFVINKFTNLAPRELAVYQNSSRSFQEKLSEEGEPLCPIRGLGDNPFPSRFIYIIERLLWEIPHSVKGNMIILAGKNYALD